MADSVVEILNTTITSTELPTSSSSHTILTTDANTSYVIKDVQANAYVDGLTAKINNFAVGDWSQTRTGSEIVDVNSTISVSCRNFPVQVQQIRASTYDNPTVSGNDELFGIVNGSEAISSRTSLFPAQPLNNVGTSYVNTIFQVNGIIYQIASDNNSVKRVYKWDIPSVRTTLQSTSYGLHDLAEDQDAIFYRSVNSLRKTTLSTGIETNIYANRWPLPDSTSTYERSAYCSDWLFEMPSNSAIDFVYAINASTGVYIKFSNLQSIQAYAVQTHLWVSYDEDTDKFYVYRNEGAQNANVYKDILPITKTQMNAYTVDSIVSTTSDRYTISNFSSTFPFDGRYYTERPSGSQTTGDVFYLQQRSSNYNVYECNFSTQTANLIAKRKSIGIDVGAYLSIVSPSPTQIEALGFESDPAEIQLRITGVKTTS